MASSTVPGWGTCRKPAARPGSPSTCCLHSSLFAEFNEPFRVLRTYFFNVVKHTGHERCPLTKLGARYSVVSINTTLYRSAPEHFHLARQQLYTHQSAIPCSLLPQALETTTLFSASGSLTTLDTVHTVFCLSLWDWLSHFESRPFWGAWSWEKAPPAHCSVIETSTRQSEMAPGTRGRWAVMGGIHNSDRGEKSQCLKTVSSF